MKYSLNKSASVVALATSLTLISGTSFAQDATLASVAKETSYVFNTLLFLIGGFLVMFMAAGFAMLEAGLVRSKNVSMQCLKNISLYSIAGIMYYWIGYNLMYTGVDGGVMGSFSLFGYGFDEVGKGSTGSYSTASDWFFQMAFVAATASIVSGTVAERLKIWPFLIFTVFLTGIIYPISGSWHWGAGFLKEAGFNDFAGSTIVHSVGGWAALVGAIILGARKGKYVDGRVVPMLASNIPLATLGTFILWLGWFGFNGASQLAMGTIGDVSDISRIFANTNLAAAGGVVATLVLMQIMYGKLDVTMALNGALAGLVSITAEPLTPGPLAAILIGSAGGVIVVFAVPLLDKLKIDDVVGAIPVHLFAGIWGTIAVVFTNSGATLSAQLYGIACYGVFTVVFSAIVWLALKYTIGIRVSEEEEALGLDRSEIGVEAYPEFTFGRG
ncbi:MAG: ammonium transporter [Rhizobiaceae bacterium]